MRYLKREMLLHDKQNGFLPGQSTTLQPLKVLDEWTEAVDRGKDVDVIYLDFRKAFDSVTQILQWRQKPPMDRTNFEVERAACHCKPRKVLVERCRQQGTTGLGRGSSTVSYMLTQCQTSYT